VKFGPGELDSGFDASLSNHFRLPRISAWLHPQESSFNQSMLHQPLEDRVALTWNYFLTNGGNNSFQLELFYDGVIRLTYLHMDGTQGIAGLSPGMRRGGALQPGLESAASHGDGGPVLWGEPIGAGCI
jgi:hypothetical protein